MNFTQCPCPQDLIDFCIGKLADDKIDALIAHLDQCIDCEKNVAAIEKLPIPFVNFYLSALNEQPLRCELDPRFRALLHELKNLAPVPLNEQR